MKVFLFVVGGIMVPIDVHAPIPGTCTYVALRGTRVFADAIKAMTLKWREDAG